MAAVSFLKNDADRTVPGAGLGWLDARRQNGAARFEKLGLPTPKLESWKYTRLRSLDNLTYSPVVALDSEKSVDKVPGLSGAVARMVFVNGRLRADLSKLDGLPKGVRLLTIEQALADSPELVEKHLGSVAKDETQAMVALNDWMMDSGFVLHVDKGTVVPGPLEVVYIGGLTDAPAAFFPRNLIIIEQGAQAVLVKHHIGRGSGAYFSNAVTEVDVADGAIFKNYKVQAESLQATHVSTQHITVGRDATYESFQLSVGGLMSRAETTLTLAGQGAHADVHGAYLMRGAEHCDMTSYVDMAVPNTTCRQVYKGVLDDESRAVFQGKIHVAKDAQKADGRMLNKTLLLSNGAEIDSKPELEIYADDVQCAHGATSGQLDETAMFYLRSRGIPEALARNMLVQSFLGDAIENISDEAVRAAFGDRVVHWLPAHCYLSGEWREDAR